MTSVHKNDETFSVGYEPQKTTRYSELTFDQVVVYSEALTADQLAESHSASDENVVLWLDFDANPEQEPEEPEEPVSKAILEYFLNAAKGLVEDGTVSGLVESVQKMFEEAIAQGETVVADENATRQEVLDAAKDLMLAIQAQDMRAADKTDLEMALELTEMIDLSKYVEAGQAEYLAAKEAAEAVLADGDAMQDETDTAWSTLIEAINALRLKAEKSVLQDLISRMEAVDLSAYTGESAAVFCAALASANTILADETLSVDAQDQVDGAVKTLQQAYDGLVKAQGGETENPENSGTSENTQNPSYGQSGSVNQNQAGSRDGNTAASGSKAVKTGDTAGNGLAAAGCISMLSLFGIALILRQRRRD